MKNWRNLWRYASSNATRGGRTLRTGPEITGTAGNDTATAFTRKGKPIGTSVLTAALLAAACGSVRENPSAPNPVALSSCAVAGFNARCGSLTVFEDRAARAGRTIALNIVVLPATGGTAEPDPIFYLAGGPGQAATSLATRTLIDPVLHERRDLVYVDQRGTGASNPLECDLPGSPDDPQGYLDEVFQVAVMEKCRDRLAARADVRHYTTAEAADDLDDVRSALGYSRINLIGASYGTRAALTYMRRHPTSVRSAVLNGVAPPSLRNPLFHARDSQTALDALFDECAADAPCRGAFPRVRDEFQSLLALLDREPARVSLRAAADGAPAEGRLSRYAFADAIRMMMYRVEGSRRVPLAIHQAYRGDFSMIVQRAVDQRRSNAQLAHGMLLSTTCQEDVVRIRDEDIPALTAQTFLGPTRVVGQRQVCSIWPHDAVPAEGGAPVASGAPVLLLSGTLDPVTPPRWAEEALKTLPNGRHLLVPGAHGAGGPCITRITRDFIVAGSVKDLETSCTAGIRLPPFVTK
jgi:pimeloyl-ACP methyl ester carboxylesterase